MISSLRGTVTGLAGATVVIEVGGVGLAVNVTPRHAASLRIGAETSMHTALIVRDDDLSLFGFSDAEDLAVFDLLRGVSGVGPKSAIGVLGAMTPAQIAAAVVAEDDAAFRRVSGIGPKTAKLIVISLAGKLAGLPLSAAPAAAASGELTEGVLAALVGLGWSERLAAQAVQEALADAQGEQPDSMAALLRLALGRLGSQQHSGASGS